MSLETERLVYVIGDVHGQLEKLIALLRGAGLVRDDLSWAGKTAVLWFMGDFFDRGPDGVGVVDLLMRLQAEAATAGGQVASLLGNHEVMLLGARRFGGEMATRSGRTFRVVWERAGGEVSDLEGLTPRHREWLTNLPAMAQVEGYLLVHANSTFYVRYGASVEEVNTAIRTILQGNDAPAWDRLIEDIRTRRFFDDSRPDGKENAVQFLRRFGGQKIVHGHVPIAFMTGEASRNITAPLIYADGLCMNLDGGLSFDGRGFVYQLPRLDEAVG